MTESGKLPGEGAVKIIRQKRVRHTCGYCGELAFYRNTYLNDGAQGARRNPASSAYGKDDCTWCSDFDDFLCGDCHQRNETDNVPEGYHWCSTFQADRFPHMFLHWQDADITPAVNAPAPPAAPRFDKTFCSQCGREFGPGDHGFSHCDNHSAEALAARAARGRQG